MDPTEYFYTVALLSHVVDWALLVARKSVVQGKVGIKTLYALVLDLVLALFGSQGDFYVAMVMHTLGDLGVKHGWLAVLEDGYVAGEDLLAADPWGQGPMGHAGTSQLLHSSPGLGGWALAVAV